MTERGRKIFASVLVVALMVGAWWVIEWRTAPPPPPAVKLPYPPVK